MNVDLLQLVEILALGGNLSALGAIKVVVIGEAMLDCYLNGVVKPLSANTSVPNITVNDQKQILGGAANIAINIHSLGGSVTLLSVIGDDYEGALLRQMLELNGISTKYISTQAGRRTLATQRIMAEEQLLMRLDQGSTDAITAKTEQALIAQLNSCFADCDAIIVSDYGYGTMSAGVISAIAQLQANQPRVLVVDSNRPATYHHLDPTVVKLNYNDAVRLLGIQAISLAESDLTNQITSYSEQLLQLTKAQITTVTIDEEDAIAFKSVPSMSEQQYLAPHYTLTEAISQLRITVAGSTFISALTLAVAAKTTQNSARVQEKSPEKVSLNKQFPLSPSVPQPLSSATEKYLTNSNELIARVAAYRASGYRIVFTNGCFDILHAGHVSYLNRAKALGDILIIGVNSDFSVSRLKGANRPLNPLSDRIQVLAALSCVDLLIAFEQDTPINLIQVISPDVYVKGGDYTKETLPEAAVVEQLGGVIEILPFVENRSTTSIIRRILQVHLSKDDITK